MKTRLGILVGAGIGYYFGTKAGRQRYEQLNQFIDNARNSKTADDAEDKLRAVADVASERAKEAAGVAKERVQSKLNKSDEQSHDNLPDSNNSSNQTNSSGF